VRNPYTHRLWRSGRTDDPIRDAIRPARFYISEVKGIAALAKAESRLAGLRESGIPERMFTKITIT